MSENAEDQTPTTPPPETATEATAEPVVEGSEAVVEGDNNSSEKGVESEGQGGKGEGTQADGAAADSPADEAPATEDKKPEEKKVFGPPLPPNYGVGAPPKAANKKKGKGVTFDVKALAMESMAAVQRGEIDDDGAEPALPATLGGKGKNGVKIEAASDDEADGGQPTSGPRDSGKPTSEGSGSGSEDESEEGERVTVMNETMFGNRVVEACEAAGLKGVTFDRDTDKISTKGESGRDEHLLLSNFYRLLIDSGGKAEENAIQAAVAMLKVKIKGVPSDLSECIDNIMPRIRNKPYYCQYELQCEVREVMPERIPHKMVVSGEPWLTVELMYDAGTTVQTVTEAHLQMWGIEFDDLLNQVQERLFADTLARHDSCWKSPPDAPGLFISFYRDGADSARILCKESIRKLDVKGKPVAIPAHRDVLLVTGTEDHVGLTKAYDIISSSLNVLDSAVITTPVYLRDSDNKWKKFTPPKANEWKDVHNTFRRAYLGAMGQMYHQQKMLLDEINKRDKVEEPMPARLTLMHNEKTGEAITYAVWQKGVETLLPKCELVMFSDPELIHQPVLGRAKWDDVERMIGRNMHPQDMYPPRFRVEKDYFPTPEELMALIQNEEE